MIIPRIIIGGTNSGVGKTTITLGIMAALTSMGYSVQPFKVGPDYIDPSYHTKVTGNPSINLDLVLTSAKIIKDTFIRYCTDKKIAVIEGVMGLFDGNEGNSNKGSSAEVAQLLQCPVILVIDAKAMARSAAAVALGFLKYDQKVRIAGIIINNVGSERHKKLLESAFQDLPVPVLGFLMKNDKLKLAERHLGLIPVAEKADLVDEKQFAHLIAEQLDMEKIVQLAASAPTLKLATPVIALKKPKVRVKIAVANDAAFNFYYQDGLTFLEEMGAELICFSPLKDRKLPQGISGIIIGGGFPELFLPQLANNQFLIDQLKMAYTGGMPIYAECGGFMYFCQGIYSLKEKYYPLVKIVPGDALMSKKLAGMGYRQGILATDSILGRQKTTVTGHEFHYSSLINQRDNFNWAFQLYNPRQEKWVKEGFTSINFLGSYLHIHWRGVPRLAEYFLKKCRYYKKEEENR